MGGGAWGLLGMSAAVGVGTAAQRRRLMWAGGLIGFSLGGFLDGILLHQVLQWHHLFSLVPGAMWRDIRNQILMDGWFHVAHYIIACIGLALLWSVRDVAGRSDRRLIAVALLGFGLWQVVDAVVFHWVLEIHRIRLDTAYPLAYDIGWLVVFGGPALLLALRLWNRPSGGGGSRVAAGLAAVALLAGPVAARPGANGATLILFREGMTPAETFAAAGAAGGPVMWASPAADVVAVAGQPSLPATVALYRTGALIVGSTPMLGGCLGWTRS